MTPPSKPSSYRKALAYFRERMKRPLLKKDFEKLDAEAKLRAGTVARVAHLSLISGVYQDALKALQTGESFGSFKKRVQDKLTRAWGQDRPWHIETIFRQNIQTAYAQGRYQELIHPDTLALRPFWKYVSVMDSRTTLICGPLNGTVLPARHSWFHSHWPPLHFNCRSAVVSLSPEQAKRLGLSHHPPTVKPAEGFGAVKGVSKPEAVERGMEDRYPPELVKAYRRKR